MAKNKRSSKDQATYPRWTEDELLARLRATARECITTAEFYRASHRGKEALAEEAERLHERVRQMLDYCERRSATRRAPLAPDGAKEAPRELHHLA